MKLFRISNFLFLGMAFVCGTILFWTSQNVQLQEKALEDLRKNLAQEKETLRVLEVEWDYLNRPERMEEIATQQLGMVPPQSNEVVVSTKDIPEPLIIPITPDLYQDVSTGKKNQKTDTQTHVDTISPSRAEKESFEKLLEELDAQGGGQ